MRRRALLTIAIAAVACISQRDRAVDTSGARTSSNPPAAPVTSQEPAPDSVITIHGLGLLRVGMTVAEARAATGTAPGTTASEGDPNSCGYIAFSGLPDGVSAMIERGRVVRLEVNRGNVPTAEGARIGDTEDRVKSIYSGRVAVTPHKYTDGHYLTVRPNAQSDSAYRIVFETDGRVVTKYRVGTVPAVEYVEGCS